MMYDKILTRSFSKQEQKKLGYAAFVVCIVLALSLCSVFKEYLDPLPVLNLQLSMGAGPKMQIPHDTSSPHQKVKAEGIVERIILPEHYKKSNLSDHKDEITWKKDLLYCNFTEPRSDYCEISGGSRIHGNSSSVFIPVSQKGISDKNSSWHIRPHARKGDGYAMGLVREWTIKSVLGDQMPQCHHTHNVPAILFSVAGYSGNYFHSISDIIIPLYITSRPFDGEVQFLVTDVFRNPSWTSKFQNILKSLSKYDIISIDHETKVHCFPSAIVGLKHHKHLGIDPLKSQYFVKDFRELLRRSYSLKKSTAITLRNGIKKKPRLLIISRKRTRKFTNVRDIVRMAKRLGYIVVVAEAEGNLSKFAQIVNSCDVMMGVHGAGLANLIFLPDKAVFIQVLGIGGMEWIADTYFGLPSKDMNLRYLEYKIKEQESSLIQQYPPGHEILGGSITINKDGWVAFRSVYLDKQDVNLDVNRFRGTLLKALELLHQ